MKYHLPKELNFGLEKDNMIKIRKLFKKFPQIEVTVVYFSFTGLLFVKIPKVKKEYCSERVITMDFVKGFSVTSLKDIEEHGLSKRRIVEMLNKAYFK